METCSVFCFVFTFDFILDCLSTVMIPASPHGIFPQFTVIQRSLQSVPSLPPRTRRTKGCRFVHLLRCEGHGDREDVSPVNKAQPTHGALVSCCLFGISTEVLLHQTFLFKCCQHHMSARQIDWRLIYTSSPPIRRWSLKHK